MRIARAHYVHDCRPRAVGIVYHKDANGVNTAYIMCGDCRREFHGPMSNEGMRHFGSPIVRFSVGSETDQVGTLGSSYTSTFVIRSYVTFALANGEVFEADIVAPVIEGRTWHYPDDVWDYYY